MIEQSHRPLIGSGPGDLDALQQRVRRRRERRRHTPRPFLNRWQHLRTALSSPSVIAHLPSRFLLHAVVALVLPLAVALSQYQPLMAPPAPPVALPAPAAGADLVAPASVLTPETGAIEGDAPLEDNGDIPVPLSLISRSEALAPVIVPALISGDRVYLRSGPGTNYDPMGQLDAGAAVQVIGRYGDWFQVRERAGTPVYWVAGELLNIPPAAVYTLFEVQQQDIPAPPPPRVALVRESGLSLRDGPGTNYVSMTKLDAGVQLDLLERYEDWFHVAVAGSEGWVKGEFLDLAPGVVERVQVAATIPDANPALAGQINENSVNLRKGPDSKYAKVGSVDAGMQVELVGKYSDWFKVRLGDGSMAWVFSDLLDVSSFVARRVPETRDFPALPVAVNNVASLARSGGGSPVSNAVAEIPASGDVASYAAQFAGSRYVYGGASPRGFDCSGLTMYVYKQFGVSLPHNAAAQFNTRYGASVGSMDNLAPGDLVFFVNTGGRRGISHVGLYLGGGRLVHAMTPRYGVQISNIYERYWVQHYYGAIRVRR